MNKLITSGLVVALCAAGLAVAAEDAKPAADAVVRKATETHCMSMKAMDTNSDGMISKDEFTAHHDAMWEKMKKDASGKVSMKDMEAMHDEKMNCKK